mgnify:CR=1 FL=1
MNRKSLSPNKRARWAPWSLGRWVYWDMYTIAHDLIVHDVFIEHMICLSHIIYEHLYVYYKYGINLFVYFWQYSCFSWNLSSSSLLLVVQALECCLLQMSRLLGSSSMFWVSCHCAPFKKTSSQLSGLQATPSGVSPPWWEAPSLRTSLRDSSTRLRNFIALGSREGRPVWSTLTGKEWQTDY